MTPESLLIWSLTVLAVTTIGGVTLAVLGLIVTGIRTFFGR